MRVACTHGARTALQEWNFPSPRCVYATVPPALTPQDNQFDKESPNENLFSHSSPQCHRDCPPDCPRHREGGCQLGCPVEEGRRGRAEGPAQDGHRALDPIIEGAMARQGLSRGHQGHRPQDRPGRQHPGQQAGREDHPPGGRDRQGPRGNAAGDGSHPGRLVLALLPAEPLAVHAADGHGRPRRARISPPGTCRASWPRSTSISPRPWPPRSNSRRSRSPSTTTCWTKGTLPDSYRPTLYDFLAHEALEFYTPGEQAGGQGGRRLRAVGRQPDLRAGRGVRRLEAEDDRRASRRR